MATTKRLAAHEESQPSMEQRIRFAAASDGFRLAWSVMGSGPPVLYPCPTHLVRSMDDPRYASALARVVARRAVLRFDQRGFGVSRGRITTFSQSIMCGDIEAVLDAAGIERVDIVSTNLLNLWVVPFVVNHPERVNRLVMHDPMLGWDVAPALKEALQKLRDADWYAYWDAVKALQMDSSPEEVKRAARLCAESVDRDDYVTFINACYMSRIEDVLPMCTTPTLVLKDDGRKIFAHEDPAEEVARLLPNAQVLTVASAGSAPMEVMTSGQVLAFLDDGWPRANPNGAHRVLSARERDVLTLIAGGKTNAQIAEALVIAESTAARHVHNIITRLGFSNRTEAATWATANGLSGEIHRPV